MNVFNSFLRMHPSSYRVRVSMNNLVSLHQYSTRLLRSAPFRTVIPLNVYYWTVDYSWCWTTFTRLGILQPTDMSCAVLVWLL